MVCSKFAKGFQDLCAFCGARKNDHPIIEYGLRVFDVEGPILCAWFSTKKQRNIYQNGYLDAIQYIEKANPPFKCINTKRIRRKRKTKI